MKIQDIRHEVSQAYAKAISQAASNEGGGCCASTCCGPKRKRTTDILGAGYGAESEPYTEAHATSFGCGNPLAFAGVKPGQTVLDLGSGAGLDLLLASDATGPTGLVIGVDMTDEMLAVAAQNIQRAGKSNIELRKGVIEELPVADASVDWVISNCVINLSPDKPAVFREISRVLKSGGRFSISDIVAQDLPTWVRENAHAYAACIAGAISEQAYLGGLKAAGFTTAVAQERLVYSAAQMQAILGDGLSDLVLPHATPTVLAELEGKIWSARFAGEKTA